MGIYWSTLVHREPFRWESLLSDALDWSNREVLRLVSKSDRLMRLLYLPNCEFPNLFTALIFLGIGWILSSLVASRRARLAQAAGKILHELPGDVPEMSPTASPSVSRASSASTTPEPESLAQRFQATQSINAPHSDSPSQFQGHVSFGVGKYDNRAIRKSAPGVQTSFARTYNPRNFFHLEETAPLNDGTLQRKDLLDADGTSTMKFRTHLRTEAAQGDVDVEEDVEVDIEEESESDEDVEAVYDSPTRSWGNRKRSESLGT